MITGQDGVMYESIDLCDDKDDQQENSERWEIFEHLGFVARTAKLYDRNEQCSSEFKAFNIATEHQECS